MPIKNPKAYPDNWWGISSRIRFERAGGRCEWTGEADGERCTAEHGKPHPLTGSKVVLTVAHLNHDTTDNRDENLMAMCQLHHLRYDVGFHAINSAKTRNEKRIAERQEQVAAGQMELL